MCCGSTFVHIDHQVAAAVKEVRNLIVLGRETSATARLGAQATLGALTRRLPETPLSAERRAAVPADANQRA
jgi:hypothetical protein